MENFVRLLKTISIIVLFHWTIFGLNAQSVGDDSCYSVGVNTGYGYNRVYGHHALFDLYAGLPFTESFHSAVYMRINTSNCYHFSLRLQPRFVHGSKDNYKGEILLETCFLYDLYLRNHIHGFNAAFMIGYKYDYITVSIGYGLRLFSDMQLSVHEAENGITEPHNLVYHVECFVRPSASTWNISVCVTNMTEYQMERMFVPLFILSGYYQVSAHWLVKARVQCKPIGIANLAPSFFGADGSIGCCYKF